MDVLRGCYVFVSTWKYDVLLMVIDLIVGCINTFCWSSHIYQKIILTMAPATSWQCDYACMTQYTKILDGLTPYAVVIYLVATITTFSSFLGLMTGLYKLHYLNHLMNFLRMGFTFLVVEVAIAQNVGFSKEVFILSRCVLVLSTAINLHVFSVLNSRIFKEMEGRLLEGDVGVNERPWSIWQVKFCICVQNDSPATSRAASAPSQPITTQPGQSATDGPVIVNPAFEGDLQNDDQPLLRRDADENIYDKNESPKSATVRIDQEENE